MFTGVSYSFNPSGSNVFILYCQTDVTPIFKKEDKQLVKNYRPISFLPIVTEYWAGRAVQVRGIDESLFVLYIQILVSDKRRRGQ